MAEREIILASHGDFSKGLLNSLKMILGDMADGVRTYSLYPGGNPLEFKEELEMEMKASDHKDYIILTDVFGGSVCNALMTLAAYDRVQVFAGMNFNMAAEIIMDSEMPFGKKEAEMAEVAAKNAIRWIQLEETEEEDF